MEVLNQYTSRTVPGYVNVLGTASNTATVTLWGDNGQYSPTTRKGEYFRGELYANNSTGAVWLTITNVAVLNNGANPDLVTNRTGRVYVPKTTETFAYDADGNLTKDGRWSYTGDAENRITSFTRISSAPSGAKVKVDCQYDSRWRRTQKIVSTWNGSGSTAQSTNRFVYDGWNLVAILNHTNGLVQSFAWGTDASGTLQGAGGVGGLISMTVHQGTNAGAYFYCYDGNHNVVALVNAANGALAGQWEYDAFGNLLRATGPLAFENPFLFSTKFYDWETRFYYYGYRYYDPDTGRWPSRDPLGELGGLDLYGFVANNPINAFDPDGQITVRLTALVVNQCGGYSAQFEFRLQNSPWPDGYIVQEIELTDNIKDCNGKVVRVVSQHFWEAWPIAGSVGPVMATVTDSSGAPEKPGTNGDGKAKGTIRFFPRSVATDVATWRPGGHPGSGSLPSTTTPPTWWNLPQTEPGSSREVSWEWKCCCPWLYNNVTTSPK